MPSALIAFREAGQQITDPFAHLREDWVQINYDLANRLWEESDWFLPIRHGVRHLRDYGIRKPCVDPERVRAVWERHRDDGPLVAPPHLTLRLPTIAATMEFYTWALQHRLYGDKHFDVTGTAVFCAPYMKEIGVQQSIGWRWEYPMNLGCHRGMSPVQGHHPVESVGVELFSLLMLAPTTWGCAMNGRDIPFVVFGDVIQCSILDDPHVPANFKEAIALRTTFNHHVVSLIDTPLTRRLSHRFAHPRRIFS